MSLTTDRACANVSCVYEGHATTCMHVRCLSNYVHATICMHVRMQDFFSGRLTFRHLMYLCIICLCVCLSACLVCMYALCVHFLPCLYVACCICWCLSFLCANKEDVWIPSPAKSLILLAMTVHAQCTLSARSVHTTVHTQCTLRFYWLFTKCEK